MKRIAVFIALLAVIGHLSHRFYFAGTWCSSKARMDGKMVIITGANTGIGRTTALDLAERGARLVLACRSERRTLPVIEEIHAANPKADVVFMELDLSSFKSVRNFAETFLAREKKLDVLVANAGLVGNDDDAVFNDDGIEMTMAVNHFGHFYLTGLLKGALSAAAPGSRLVVVSSQGFMFANDNAFLNLDDLKNTGGVTNVPDEMNLPDAFVPVFVLRTMFSFLRLPRFMRYSNSKLANILFVKEFARRFGNGSVNAYSVHPGLVQTDIGVPRTAMDSWGVVFGEFVKTIMPNMKTAVEGAQTQICLAVSEDYAAETGGYYQDCAFFEVKKPEVHDDALAAALWRWSEGVIAEAIKNDDYRF